MRLRQTPRRVLSAIRVARVPQRHSVACSMRPLMVPPTLEANRSLRTSDALAAVMRAAPPVRGKQALGRRLMGRAERRGALGDDPWAVRLKDGTQLELPRKSRMSWSVAFAGDYDRALVTHTSRFIEPGTIVLDVGASLGLWTVQLANIAATQNASVWAFEPNPANIPWIRRNLTLNKLTDTVTVCEMGLGDSPGTATLVGAEYGVGNGLIAIKERDSTEKNPRVPVALKCLDEIDLPARISFIKIDVEGFEVAFLRGAAEVIRRDRPVIFGEFSAAWIERRGEDLRSALVGLDYDVAALRLVSSHRWSASHVVESQPVDLAGSKPIPQDLLLTPRTA